MPIATGTGAGGFALPSLVHVSLDRFSSLGSDFVRSYEGCGLAHGQTVLRLRMRGDAEEGEGRGGGAVPRLAGFGLSERSKKKEKEKEKGKK